MSRETYLSDLAAELQRRGADSPRINEIVADVDRELTSRGAEFDPKDEFGPAADYAEKLMLRDEDSITPSGVRSWVFRSFRATAFDEMNVLADAGRQGWELMDVGILALNCRRPKNIESATQWEYERRFSLDRKGILADMVELGWEPCGIWAPFHYFKRDLKQPAVVPR